MKFTAALVLGLLVSSHVFAGTTETAGRSDSISKTHSIRSPSLIQGVFEQAVDHFGGAAGQKFNQRYWTDSSHASGPDAPVIYHICGEGACDEDYFLKDSAIDWAKTLGARLVYLEHRYYGNSIPFGELTAPHMQYLTLNNVMADLVTFQKWISTNQGWSGKWISVGGSYSGTLSAIYRQLHPEMVVGALASSAPMISGIGQDQGTQSDVNGLSYTDASNNSGNRPWVYQSCVDFGFWQASGGSLFSVLMSPSAWLCHTLFGNITLVDKAAYNQKYYTPFITASATAPSNILFTYGSKDVWTKIGITPQSNLNSKVTVQVINGAGHHYDLNAASSGDSADVKTARQNFLTAARQWLQ